MSGSAPVTWEARKRPRGVVGGARGEETVAGWSLEREKAIEQKLPRKKTKNTDDAGDGVALGGIVSTVANTLVAKSVNGLYANDS